ncbi:aryl-sulfate sulfotransferase [Flagellimonas halotolerans]|uniref:Aryl-sulfate sulfotransferase n=1 Tax=Flagellimonas halotolerans TaxID=3112164 RepID=A0ABU6ISX0_9FLAO|nr:MULTISPECIES: aryl-sulfate sulfotransferase [unclassified Allomuricauda]MEC3966301.1 aryl-sulfate sulfotransferase [Muricauda sp. SYSU M86414]MEC4266166.1 aryl-sulfate sulfotransferase [Muricauda sp. SYSU M84420]
MLKSSIKTSLAIICCTLLLCCSNNDNSITPDESGEETPEQGETPTEETPQENNEEVVESDLGTVTYFNKALAEDHYILVNDAMNNHVYLMDKNGDLVYEWPLGDRKIGNDVVLLEDGTLLAALQAEGPDILFGGFGGKIQIIDKEGNALWDFTYSNSNHRLHHDVELLPNGNVLGIAWEKMTQEEALASGSKHNTDLYPESILEINPTTDEIVWEWHAKDHLIQDFDDTKLNFGEVAANPQLIDLNYVNAENGNIMHINGLGYDAINDLIFLSVNFYSEVWILDHSTTTEVAASHSGGNFGRGGDLVYRFGNPSAYGDDDSERMFVNNHYPNLFEPGKMLIFTNGGDLGQSTVYELGLPNALTQESIPTLTSPEILWSFTDTELYSPKVSGAVRLPNGNTLITEGDYGIWEVTTEGEVVWKFSGDGFFWRSYHYAKDHPGIIALDL